MKMEYIGCGGGVESFVLTGGNKGWETVDCEK